MLRPVYNRFQDRGILIPVPEGDKTFQAIVKRVQNKLSVYVIPDQ
jgi:hypothetical protein